MTGLKRGKKNYIDWLIGRTKPHYIVMKCDAYDSFYREVRLCRDLSLPPDPPMGGFVYYGVRIELDRQAARL